MHACWHQPSIDLLEATFGGNRFPEGIEGFRRASTKGDPIYDAVEVVLKGPELHLAPYDLPAFLDKGGDRRDAARVRWWQAGATRIGDLIDLAPGTRQPDGNPYPPVGDLAASDEDRSYAYSDPIPVVYGHHWRQWEPEQHLDWTPRTASVDFSAVKGGPLAAYQWRGETEIDPTHYVRYPATLDG